MLTPGQEYSVEPSAASGCGSPDDAHGGRARALPGCAARAGDRAAARVPPIEPVRRVVRPETHRSTSFPRNQEPRPWRALRPAAHPPVPVAPPEGGATARPLRRSPRCRRRRSGRPRGNAAAAPVRGRTTRRVAAPGRRRAARPARVRRSPAAGLTRRRASPPQAVRNQASPSEEERLRASKDMIAIGPPEDWVVDGPTPPRGASGRKNLHAIGVEGAGPRARYPSRAPACAAASRRGRCSRRLADSRQGDVGGRKQATSGARA